MLRFLRSHLHNDQTRTDDLQDYFQYHQTVRCGFPNGACAVAVDKVLSIQAIGTQQGEILVIGGLKCMWRSVVPNGSPVAYIYFAQGTGSFMVLCQDQSFHKFSISGQELVHQAIPPEARLKRITSCEMYQKRDLTDARLLIGTMTGNVFSIKMDSCELTEFILYEDTMLPRLPPEARTGSSIDGISVNPKDPRQVLIIIDQKCVLLYDVNVHEVVRTYMQSCAVHNISWCADGVHFMIAFADGGYARWAADRDVAVDDNFILFGPFPCTPVNKIFHSATQVGDTIIFSGGLPRASYGDRYTVTAKRGQRVSVFDFASPVLDFTVVPESNDCKNDGFFMAGYLLVLCEQELLMIDLGDRNWKEVPLLYLHSLHFSQITACTLAAEVEEHVWKDLHKASEKQHQHHRFSRRPWPITARQNENRFAPSNGTRQVIVTGHENGNVRIWAAGDLFLKLLVTLKSSKEFHGMHDEEPRTHLAPDTSVRDSMYDSADDSDENPTSEWPPFAKMGEYDPFCDDHRLAVQKLAFDAASGRVAIGGRGGHVFVYHFAEEQQRLTPSVVDPPLVPGDQVAAHIGRLQGLRLRSNELIYDCGYQPYSPEGTTQSIAIQLKPATPITALALLASRPLVACGNEFGFLVVDLKTKQTLVNCSLCSGQDLLEAGALDDALSRFKSMKKSIRQSFRRKKKTRQTVAAGSQENSHVSNSNSSPDRRLNPIEDDDDDEEVIRPVERKIEARAERTSPETPVWLIRVLSFSKAPMLSSASQCDCLWVGSNGGRILCYVISPRERPEDSCRLVRDVRMEHGAPIINIEVQADPLNKSSLLGSRLMVFTEEQIRSFTLPQLKPTRYKYKLTALEGERIRKATIVKLVSSTDRRIDDVFACVLTNQGNVMMFSLVHPRKKIAANVLKYTDILGMSSFTMSPSGEMFILRSGGSEYQRSSMAKSEDAPSTLPLTFPS